jgi:adenylylsulfate kinase
MTKDRQGAVLWFTGLSGSGKTTLANALKERLILLEKSVKILDGDAVRSSTHRHLGFSREDIRENNRLLAEMAVASAKSYDVVIVAVIAPFREDRAVSRKIIGGNFYEIFLDCPIEKCVERDAKGLYKKARSGEIQNFIGVSPAHPYEAPEAPDLRLKTDTDTKETDVEHLLTFLSSIGLL